MPPKTPYPTPALRLHNGAWKIVWSHGGKQYSVSTGLNKDDRLFADKWRVEFAIALKQDIPSFPEKFADAPGVVKYVSARYGVGVRPRESSGDWLADYAGELKGECSGKWAEMSLVRLRKLHAETNGVAALTAQQASAYLAGIAARQKAGTRNRYLGTFSRFYKWAVRTGRTKVNPFADIKQIKEERTLHIVHCTPAEREEAISMARETGWPDWLSIPIAFYAGMRREEVSRLEWEDVRFSEGLIVIRKSKTGKGRIIPLSSALEQILMEVPESKRRGHVVDIEDGIDRPFRMDNLVRHIRRMKRDQFLAAHSIEKPTPSRSKEYAAKKKSFEAEKKKRATDLHVALERIGWNPFRHTFGFMEH